MIIRRHGYDPDQEVNSFTAWMNNDDLLVKWEQADCNGSHTESIQEIHHEGKNIILFTSENW
jgi:hypothetical protein